MKKTTQKIKKTSRELRTLSDLAGAIGRPLPTVYGWTQHADWPFRCKAPWQSDVVPEVLRWAAETLAKGRPMGHGPMTELRREKIEQEIRKLRAQADQAETALAKERGELMLAADVEREWASIGVAVRSGFESVPSQIVPLALAHGMPHEESGKFATAVEEIIAGVLRHLSRRDERPGESETSTAVAGSEK